MASCLVLTPGEVIKQNAQMIQQQQQQQSSHTTPSRSTSLLAFKRVLASGRLFTGYSALVARNLPFTALQFPMFEHIRARLWEHRSHTKGMQKTDRERRGVGESGLIAGSSAAIAGSIAAFVTTPSDVIKTRMMVSIDDEALSTTTASRKGLASIRVVRDVWRERGLRGFFRGAAFRSAWTAVGSGLYLGMYDAAKLWIERRQ